MGAPTNCIYFIKKWMFGSRTSLSHYYFQPIGTEYLTFFVLFPNRRPFTPDIFNSLSPYYNPYMVNTTIQDLQQVFDYSQMTSNFPSLICFCSTNDTKEAQLISNIEGGAYGTLSQEYIPTHTFLNVLCII